MNAHSLKEGAALLFSWIVCSFAFQAIRMADVVSVFLIELVVCNPTEGLPPKHNSLFNRQTQHLLANESLPIRANLGAHLQEQSILQPSKVLQVMIPPQSLMERPHTHGIMLLRDLIYHLRLQLVSRASCSVVAHPFGWNTSQEALSQVLQYWDNSVIFV